MIDRGWGCGWRNAQMLVSAMLMRSTEWRESLFGGCGYVPDIGSLQAWLEAAWHAGFDVEGCAQFGGSVQQSLRWIGTTEVISLLRVFRIRAQFIDFVGTHSAHNIFRPQHLGSLHHSIACDLCKRRPIEGIRHTSLAVPDYDLCDHCIRDPRAQHAGPFESHGTAPIHLGVKCSMCEVENILGVRYRSKKKNPQVDMCSRCVDFSQTTWGGRYVRVMVPEGDQDLENENRHRRLIEWIWNYFSSGFPEQGRGVVHTARLPLYFQHEGHSRTVVGIERYKKANGGIYHNLLILDPGIPDSTLEEALTLGQKWQQLVKRGPHTLRKPEYQLTYIEDGLVPENEMDVMKRLGPADTISS
ncbi:unnamed protein product [Ostreobium quekettii]|uniref:ZZ-type domain-containing protein n=1 Tax=Ostreobium quekettii TaxID=121088 RepID=A0A8S1IPI5_9CHLO|nr:unnamed protein product [Ostreobium quekettii]